MLGMCCIVAVQDTHQVWTPSELMCYALDAARQPLKADTGACMPSQGPRYDMI